MTTWCVEPLTARLKSDMNFRESSFAAGKSFLNVPQHLVHPSKIRSTEERTGKIGEITFVQ